MKAVHYLVASRANTTSTIIIIPTLNVSHGIVSKEIKLFKETHCKCFRVSVLSNLSYLRFIMSISIADLSVVLAEFKIVFL